MSFVGDLLDANMQKEMSEEVKDFEANVNTFQFEFEYGGTQGDGTKCKSKCTCIQTYHFCLDPWW